MTGRDPCAEALLPELGQHFSYDPDRILSPTAYPSGGGGMVGTAAGGAGPAGRRCGSAALIPISLP
ncbi:hypothetical protein PE067_18030 [Paracoccus sp. DMF-8]|uniref:hypothetical protein n=1 Tax=Paracoccus sp. DMF-8 TaxID=3019445 RepID=UPI0023E3BC84|nr:hypothetical protein [Paracoccus sp. DMF-8]MDF3607873.1 hypothetical protein [Paracoccus sp. DMF-8]